ncbi:MAG TPA: hypothetical protein ENO21_02520 [Firmicutes bacterium]|nr:hypothetical protein [Bacillota bacterium]
MAWYLRQTNYPYKAWLVFLVALAVLLVAASLWLGRFSSEEARTLGAAHRLRDAIEAYTFERGTYPAKLADVRAYLPKGRWPDNAYAGGPLGDTGDPDFDPAVSPGNVYYERVFVGEGLEGYAAVAADARQVGYVLHVFGADGEIWTYRGRTLLPVE